MKLGSNMLQASLVQGRWTSGTLSAADLESGSRQRRALSSRSHPRATDTVSALDRVEVGEAAVSANVGLANAARAWMTGMWVVRGCFLVLKWWRLHGLFDCREDNEHRCLAPVEDVPAISPFCSHLAKQRGVEYWARW